MFNAHNVKRAESLTSSIKQSMNQNKYYDKKYHPTPNIPETSDFEQMLQQSFGGQEGNMLRLQTSYHNSLETMRKLRISKVEGRLQGPSEALLYK